MKEVILVFARRDDVFVACKRLAREGQVLFLVKPGDIYRQLGASIFQINPKEQADYRRLLEDVRGQAGALHRIVHLWNYESDHLDYAYHGDIKRFVASANRSLVLGTESVERLTRAMAASGCGDEVRIDHYHHGTGHNLQPQNWMMENRYLHLPLEQSRFPFVSQHVPAPLEDRGQMAHLILSAPAKQGASLPQAAARPRIPLKTNGVYLVVNDQADTGWQLGTELLDKYQSHVVLIGEGELSAEKQEVLRAYNRDGVRLAYEQADGFEADALKALFARVTEQFHRVHGIFYHLSGRDHESYAHNMNGMLILDDLTAELPVDFYLIAGEKHGQTERFGDGFAALRKELVKLKKRNGLSHSLGWNMADRQGSVLDLYAKFVQVEVEQAAAAAVKQIDVNDEGVKERLVQLIRGGISTLIAETLRIDEREVGLDFAISLDAADGKQFDSISLTMLAEKIRVKYDVKLTPVAFFQHKKVGPLIDFLFKKHSAKFVEYYRLLLEADTGAATEAAPSVETASAPVEAPAPVAAPAVQAAESAAQTQWGWLDGGEEAAASTESASTYEAYDSDDENAVAIIGASGIFPGSPNIRKLWDNLSNGRHLVSEIPADRWDWKACYGDPHAEENKTNIKWGGFIDGIDHFDPAFFGISEKEAKVMDPRQRLFLEAVWTTVEDAGYKMSDLSGTQTAVVVGAGASEYYELCKEHGLKIEEQSSTAKSNSILANRISFLFNFRGPSEAVDVACASSLVAIHKAVQHIQNGDSELAIAGGVHLILTPDMHISFSQGGVLSEDGRCKAFDKSADGYVRSEGVGAVLLKPLKQALADRDHIYAVVKGSATNHGGRSNSMTSPSPEAQEDVLVKAYQQANVSPSTLSYIEAHGSSTNLGDPIEIMALNSAYSRLVGEADSAHCGIGCVKTHIGHTEEAAGMAALFKVLMGMKHGTIPGNLHFNELNPYIDLEGSPFYIVGQKQAWNRLSDADGGALPRRAGISAFGFGGVNAHVVVEEVSLASQSPRLDEHLIVLSAHDPSTLKRVAQELADFLDAERAELNLTDLAYTLQVGREEMPERLAFVVRDRAELRAKLLGETGVFRGSAAGKKRSGDLQSPQGLGLAQLAQRWVEGEAFDWNQLYPARPARVSLPTYPFNKRRYWYPTSPTPPGPKGGGRKKTPASLSLWNNTAAEYPRSKSVLDLIEAQAQRRPDAVAARFRDFELTYGQLVQDVHQLAAYLQQRGVQAGSYVGIFLNRSLEMLVSVLAVLKAGGTYIPLDPVFPQDRIQHIMEDSGLAFLITESRNVAKLPRFYGEMVVLDHELEGIQNAQPTFFRPVDPEERIAYAIYTSGSTGKPKGIEVYERSLINFLWSMAQEPGLQEGDTLLAVTTICFDIAGLELFLPLIQGATVEVLPESVTKDGLKLKQILDEGYATVMQATPATWEMVLAAGWQGSPAFKILCGGEALSQHLADRLLDRCGELWNLYGPTETTIWSTVGRVTRGGNVTVGRPIANTQAYILDEEMNPVPLGVEGELWIAGDGLAKGYLNRPDLNREKFLPNPFAPGERIYRTGDLAFASENGGITLCGRIDHQIKLNGYRIELEEIENILRTIPEVEQAAVVVREAASGQKALAAFYAVKAGAQPLKHQQIVSTLSQHLPSYMIPSVSTCLPSLPLTLNLKVDRKALMEMNVEDAAEAKLPSPAPGASTDLETELRRIVAGLLHVDASEIEPDVKLGQYGFNSLLYTRLAMEINERLGTEVTAVHFFKYSTVAALAALLAETVPMQSAQEAPEEEAPADDPVAIIGMFGRMPESPDLDAFWDNLLQNKNMVTEIPSDRWDYREYYGNPRKDKSKSDSKWGGFLAGVDCFDAGFFAISPREAEYMDPRQRLLIESVWKTFEDSGYKPTDFSGTRTGLFIGAINSDYWDVMNHLNVAADGYTLSGFANSLLANRVSYMFNLRGPSEVFDTACSSSLTAIDKAVKALKNGECDMAVAGGVNLILSPNLYLALSQNGMLSPDGACKAFDHRANGYVRGEGVGTILLKPLSKALADGDHVYALIKGSAVNHGGKANSLTAPNPDAQAELLVEAYAKSGVHPSTVTYIEAHGTGTKLGDPIEVEALKTAFTTLYEQSGQELSEQPHCGIGAVKTNIGHLEAAAGIAGVIKTVLAMKEGWIPASIHFEEQNPYIDLDDSCFYLVTENKRWDRLLDPSRREVPRRAGVSSFGFGGANAHVVLEEFVGGARTAGADEANVIVLSARDEERLRDYAQALLNHADADRVSLAEMAYTLQTGRNAMEERLAIVVRDVAELKEKLAAYLEQTAVHGIYSRNVKHETPLFQDMFAGAAGREFFKVIVQEKDFHKLAQLWVAGIDVDWTQLYPHGLPQRASLPTYPFAKERYWVSGSTDAPVAFERLSTVRALTPLIDSNESDLEELCYKKRFEASDRFVREHVVQGEMIIPGVVSVEMARMAGDLANKNAGVTALKNLVWLRPIEVKGGGQDVYINLYPKGDEVEFRINTRGDDAKTIHAQGLLAYEQPHESALRAVLDLDAIRERATRHQLHEEFYSTFRELGYDYGATFKPIRQAYTNATEALTQIQLPDGLEGEFGEYFLHPSIMEGVLQTLAALLFKKGDPSVVPFVPFSLSELNIVRPLVQTCYAYLTLADAGQTEANHRARYNMTLVDEQGRVLAQLRGYSVRPVHNDPAPLPTPAAKPQPTYYQPQLRPAPLAEQVVGSQGAILLFDRDDSLLMQLEQQARVVLVRPGAAFRQFGPTLYEINPAEYGDYLRLLRALKDAGRYPTRIVHRWTRGEFTTQGQLEMGAYSLFHLGKGLLEEKLEGETRLLAFYESEEAETQPLLKALKGMMQSIRMETAKLRGKVVEVKGMAARRELASILLQELSADEPFVLVQDGTRYAESLEEVRLTEWESGAPVIREDGVYLITGGTGGLGLLFAEHLAQNSRAKVVLTGRSALTAEKAAQLQRWSNVVYLQADVTKAEAVRALRAEIFSRFGKVNGILHCAGEIRDDILAKKTHGDFEAVIGAKVHGTLNLDAAFRDEALDFFAVFSSISSLLGNIGQTDYAFANAFLDAYAHQHSHVTAINWPLWKDGGMQVTDEVRTFIQQFFGTVPLETATGLAGFETALRSPYRQLLVLEQPSEKVKKLSGGNRVQAPAPVLPQVPVYEQAAVPQANVTEQVQEEVTALVSQILKVDRAKIATNKDMGQFGFDSISFTDLANHVNDLYDSNLTPAVFFELDPPTIDSFVELLTERYPQEVTQRHRSVQTQTFQEVAAAREEDLSEEPPRWREVEVQRRDDQADDAVAIIGMAGVMPQSDDLEEFWTHLEAGRDLITEVPRERFDWQAYYGDPMHGVNKTDSKWGGFMKEVDSFDALFFGISPREAELMDPQHRIFMETVWKAIEDSGYKASDLSGTNTGVYVGMTNHDYADVLRENLEGVETQGIFGNTHPFLPNRISFLLNLHGPSEPIDTLCSSSLVAIHRAVEDLKHGNCELAIAGGVSVIAAPTMHIAFSQAQMLSADGHCKSFDKSANGFVRGEGVGALILKPLKQALADGDHVYAVVRGTAVNHGGRSYSLTAPNAKAQAELLKTAYQKANLPTEAVSYLEAHGTGTILGDPVEINGLKMAFKGNAPHCGIGSVKTNIGHLEAAAGMAGVMKVLLAMKHKTLPASLHVDEVNPYIDVKNSPFYIVDRTQPWKRLKDANGNEIPRIAGVSSFGAGGTNAHVVLEEFEPPARQGGSGLPQVVVLSAKSEESLERYAASLRKAAERIDDLASLAYTLQTGREPMEHRLALVVSSVAELREKLEKGDVFRGVVTEEEASEATNPSRDLVTQAQWWVRGGKVDWDLLRQGPRPSRLPLPTYPFARERHWVETKSQGTLHPLVHQGNSARFTGQEFFFQDHVVGGGKLFPGVAYVEMARAAAELTGTQRVRGIQNVVWARPLFANGEPFDVNIRFQANEFEVHTADAMHAQGEVVYGDPILSNEIYDIAALEARGAEVRTGAQVYRDFAERGFAYGSSFQTIQQLRVNEGMSISRLQLPANLSGEADRFALHPSLMDGALQTAVQLLALRENASHRTHMPFSLGEVELIRPIVEPECVAYATDADDPAAGAQVRKFNIVILDTLGRPLVKLKDFAIRRLQPELDAGLKYYRNEWAVNGLEGLSAADNAATGDVLIFGRPSEGDRALSGARRIFVTEGGHYRKLGNNAYEIRPDRQEDYVALFDDLRAAQVAPQTIIHAWSLNGGERVSDNVKISFHSLMSLAQVLFQQRFKHEVQVLYVYAGDRPEYAAMSGLARTIQMENPRFLCKTVSMDEAALQAYADIIGTELAAVSRNDREVRYQNGFRYVQQVQEIHETQKGV